MPGFIAKQLCPNLVIVPCNFEKYTKASRKAKSILSEYDVTMRSHGLDEACLKLTDHVHNRTARTFEFVQYDGECKCWLPRKREELMKLSEDVRERTEQCSKCKKELTVIQSRLSFGDSVEDAVKEMRLRVEQKTGLTCSAGMLLQFKG